jgi:hypothetical protein
MEADINDRARLLPGGLQLDFKNGLPYLRCRKPTMEEVSSLPHIIMIADKDRDPSVYDNDIGFMTHQWILLITTTLLICMGNIDTVLFLSIAPSKKTHS